MKTNDIIKILEGKWKPILAEEWDNVGLLVGSANKDIKTILVALDPTDDVVEQAIEMKADMIITHHPIIFSRMKKITDEDYLGRRIIKLIKNNISCYATHTDFDVCDMGKINEESLELVDTKILQKTVEGDNSKGLGRVGKIKQPKTLANFATEVKNKLAIDDVRVFGEASKQIEIVAISSGAGIDAAADAIKAGADVLVTGDVKHNAALNAVSEGLTIIDAGHFGTEYGFAKHVRDVLAAELTGVTVRAAKENAPYWVV